MGSKLHFVILSKADVFSSMLKREFEKQPLFSVEVLDAAHAAIMHIRQHPVQCLILNIDHFGLRQIRLVEQVRAMGYRFQIFIFAAQVNDEAAKLSATLRRLVIFSRDAVEVDRDLVGLCSRFLKPQKTPVRLSSRKNTKQPVTIERLQKRNLRFIAHLQNMSSKGALLNFRGSPLNLNERVRVVFHLDEIKKTHAIEARVAWVGFSKTGSPTAGLKFTGGSRRSLRVF